MFELSSGLTYHAPARWLAAELGRQGQPRGWPGWEGAPPGGLTNDRQTRIRSFDLGRDKVGILCNRVQTIIPNVQIKPGGPSQPCLCACTGSGLFGSAAS